MMIAESLVRLFPSIDFASPVGGNNWPLPNVWIGVSCENQQTADERIPLLLQTPAAVRFTSAEPLLGSLDLRRWTRIAWQCSGCREYFAGAWQKTCPSCKREHYWTGSPAFNPHGRQTGSGLDWVIAGGESGPGARPCDVGWIRSIRDQCKNAGVPLFIKQLGRESYYGVPGNLQSSRLEDKKGGDISEWPEDLRIREFPPAAVTA